MANKRDLKKQIRYACGDAAAEILIALEVENLNRDAVAAIVGKIAELQVNSLKNATFAFDKSPRDFDNRNAYNKARREYTHTAYARLRQQFMAGLQDVVKDMNATLSDEIKEANKKALKA